MRSACHEWMAEVQVRRARQGILSDPILTRSRKASLPGNERIAQASEQLIHNLNVCWLLEYLACGAEGQVCRAYLRRPSVASRSSCVGKVSYNSH